jgi:hypothetical protein
VAVTDPTADQLSDLRADLDDQASAGFSDAELTRLWQRAGGRHERTLWLAVRQLLMQANKFNDYAFGMGASDEKKSQIRAHLRDMLDLLGSGSGSGGSGLASIQLTTATTTRDPYAVLTDEETA